MIPRKQAFPNDDAGISIGVAVHLTLWAIDKGSTRGISFCRFLSSITGNQSTTTGTRTTGIPGGDAAGEDVLVPRFVFAVLEDFPP